MFKLYYADYGARNGIYSKLVITNPVTTIPGYNEKIRISQFSLYIFEQNNSATTNTATTYKE